MQQRRTPRLAASGLDNVSYVSGFSKTLTANSRVSFAVVSPQLAADGTLKMACGDMTSEMAEQIICTMLSDGNYSKHMTHGGPALSRTAGWRVGEVKPGVRSSLPGEGLYIWTRLPDGYDAETLARKGLEINWCWRRGPCSARPDGNQFCALTWRTVILQVRERFLPLAGQLNSIPSCGSGPAAPHRIPAACSTAPTGSLCCDSSDDANHVGAGLLAKGGHIQHQCRLQDRLREQARSHRDCGAPTRSPATRSLRLPTSSLPANFTRSLPIQRPGLRTRVRYGAKRITIGRLSSCQRSRAMAAVPGSPRVCRIPEVSGAAPPIVGVVQ